MDRLIGEHRGRIANTAGDSVLAEFPSVVDAVQCAAEVQQALAEANEGVPEDRRMRFRIGVHVGDVMVRGADLLGDGVNVAARLQALADPGGVCLSGRRTSTHARSCRSPIEDLGHQTVRNIEEPIRAYAREASRRSEAQPRPPEPGSETSPLPDRPSIAVLPFREHEWQPRAGVFRGRDHRRAYYRPVSVRWVHVSLGTRHLAIREGTLTFDKLLANYGQPTCSRAQSGEKQAGSE